MKKNPDSTNKALSDACELALKQPLPEKQLDVMTGASCRTAAYALKMGDNADQEIQSQRKN